MKNEIHTFLHCAKCLSEKPPNISARNWSLVEVGLTSKGIQIWCRRHEANIVHIDFNDGKKVYPK